jgi:hypothetical protein
LLRHFTISEPRDLQPASKRQSGCA